MGNKANDFPSPVSIIQAIIPPWRRTDAPLNSKRRRRESFPLSRWSRSPSRRHFLHPRRALYKSWNDRRLLFYDLWRVYFIGLSAAAAPWGDASEWPLKCIIFHKASDGNLSHLFVEFEFIR
ncbi:hypothetical protein GWI33_006275 [Rhynchophorus ferrugineus]|uniref:Uncharacterized protein n=1 Tax=Rhynchophorus ferrugineus TaxID=354439 RepID=A0A834IFB0_RHYFE|nr:hypothetical protein GWI33_006275 [Rhynchophorus ferrugineus]